MEPLVNGVHHQCVRRCQLRRCQRSLRSDHVAGAAHPAAAQAPQCLPCFGPGAPSCDGEGGNEGHRDGDGKRQKPPSILGPSLMILRMSQRNGIRKIIAYTRLFFSTGRRAWWPPCPHAPSVQRIMVMRVQQNDRWCIVEEFRLRVAIATTQQCGNEHQHGDVGETVVIMNPILSFCAILRTIVFTISTISYTILP